PPSYAGFVNSHAATNLPTAPSCSTTYTHVAGSGPGNYATSCAGGVSANYAFNYIDGNFHVGKAPLDVTASSPADGVYGAPVPTITASYAGFVYSQDATNLDSTQICSNSYHQIVRYG